jgi:hypothetical protein
MRSRAPVDYGFRFDAARWVAFEAAGTALSLIPSRGTNGEVGDAGGWLLNRESAGLHAGTEFHLEPGESREQVTWLAVTDDPRQGAAYAVLGAVGELP